MRKTRLSCARVTVRVGLCSACAGVSAFVVECGLYRCFYLSDFNLFILLYILFPFMFLFIYFESMFVCKNVCLLGAYSAMLFRNNSHDFIIRLKPR